MLPKALGSHIKTYIPDWHITACNANGEGNSQDLNAALFFFRLRRRRVTRKPMGIGGRSIPAFNGRPAGVLVSVSSRLLQVNARVVDVMPRMG